MDELYSEKQKLLGSESFSISQSYGSSFQQSSTTVQPSRKRRHRSSVPHIAVEHIVLRKHIGLLHAIAFIVGGVAGSGIFIAPTGVTADAGSVGSSLVIWVACGLLNLLLALCYAELGTAMPVAGGDYAYVNQMLGPFPAYMILWLQVILVGPVSTALLSKTTAEYTLGLADAECHVWVVAVFCVWINMSFSWLQSVTLKWANRSMLIFTAAKLLAFAVIIVTGIINLTKGHTANFQHPFEGSVTNPVSIAVSVVPGFVSYIGWDAANNLVEEMKNPGRDLPLSLGLSMGLVTVLYVCVNIAYFTVLSPAEFVQSHQVAKLYAQAAMPSVAWLIPVLVALSAAGSVSAMLCAYPRVMFAGGQSGQLPIITAGISVHYFTPIPAIIVQTILSSILCLIPWLDIDSLLLLTGVVLYLKMTLALVALLYLKWRYSHLPRTVKVPTVLVLVGMLCLVVTVGLALYEDPLLNGMGCAVFLLSVPVYFLVKLCPSDSPCLEKVTRCLQQLLVVVPGGKTAAVRAECPS